MKYALIQSNVVKEVFDEKPDLHPSLEVRECDDFVTEGFVFDRGTFLSPDNLITAQEVKEKKSKEISALRETKMKDGFLYQGHTFQIDLEAQKDMTAVQVQFLAGHESPHGGFWRDKENNAVEMNDQEVQGFFQAAFSYVLNIKKSAWTHKENLNNLSAKNDIVGYDISKNW
jgi:hypothetical protein